MSRDTSGKPTSGKPTSAPAAGSATTSTGSTMPPVPGPGESTPRKKTGSQASQKSSGPSAGSAATTGTSTPASGSATPAAASATTGTAPAAEAPASGPASFAPAASRSTAESESKVPHTPVAEKAPLSGAQQKKAAAAGPRRVRLALSRIDPWSVMKLSFLLSIAIGIMIVVASVVFWLVLDGLHVFTEVNDMIVDILGEETNVNILQFVELKRVVSLSTMIAIVDVVLLTALSTIGAFLYNVVAALVGGVHVTLTDE